MKLLGKLLCLIGWHHIVSTERTSEHGVYYTEVRCTRCTLHRNLTEWDGWNP